jgi:NitT/TauT family transport system substrate-binding protein
LPQHKTLGFIPLLLCFVFPCGESIVAHLSHAAEKIVVAYSSINPISSHIEITRLQGFFRKYGIEPENILVRSSATVTAGLAAGNVHIGHIGGSALLNAATEGLPLKMLAAFDDQLMYDVMARPEIKSANDLKGKRFGVGSLGGTPWMAAKLAFEHLGLDEKRDRIQIIAMANQVSRYQALGQGSIDAAILQGNFSRVLKEKGFTLIVDLEEANIPTVGAGTVVSSGFLRENRGTVDSVLKALLESQSFILNPQDKSTVTRLMGIYLRERDPQALEDGYRVLYSNLSRKPYPSKPGLNNIKRMLAISNPKASNVKIDDVVDESFMRKLDSSGFLDRALAGSL